VLCIGFWALNVQAQVQGVVALYGDFC
jgi:hypothetical protein